MHLEGAEVAAAKTAIRRRHGCDSYYIGSYRNQNRCEIPVVHELVLDDSASTAYVWFLKAELCIVLKGPDTASPSAAVMSRAARPASSGCEKP
jgi:hypothetical protein